ncbi:MAG: Na+ ATPase [Chaenotheca gracillima]|nr:MAG: Na+ ATPase [Chaenotheca gracillima]
MVSSDKDQMEPKVEHVESPSARGRPGFGTRLMRHYKKFWWLHLIIFIAIFLIITLPLIYVGFPNIAQSNVNDSGLEIDSMVLSDPTPNSFHLHQEGAITSDSTYHPKLDSFNVSLFIADGSPNPTTFAYVEQPSVQSGSHVPITIDETVQIADLDEFTKYSVTVMNSEEYQLGVSGRMGLHEGKFPATTVDYNKVVTLKGLNKLKGFNVTSFKILGKADPDGANMLGTVYIPNASIMTLVMGNVTMNLYCQGDFIGTSLLPDLTLKPGNNTVDMRSTTNQTLVFSKLSQFKDGIIPIDIIGNSSVYNGQHLTYYEEALKSNEQHIELNLGAASV